jgi:hypothetical protein
MLKCRGDTSEADLIAPGFARAGAAYPRPAPAALGACGSWSMRWFTVNDLALEAALAAARACQADARRSLPGQRHTVAVEHARGDRERGVDERDLDIAVTVGSPLDERQGGEDPFGVGEVLTRGSRWLWCAVHGPDLVSGQGPVVEFAARGRSA